MAADPKLLVASYVSLLERAESVPSLLPPAERPDGHRLLLLCRQVEAPKLVALLTNHPQSVPAAELSLRQELGRLVEYLARRHAAGIPLAALGRTLLAGLAGRQHDFAHGCGETNQKLSLLGL